MGLYEGIKDVAKVIQQADNVELYKQLIDLSTQALDMQNEISLISAENAELKKMKDLENRFERHQEPYITLFNDSERIFYCFRCWDHEKKLIQVKSYDSGAFKCTHCENNGAYDKAMYEEHQRREKDSFRAVNARNRRNYF